MGSKRTWQGQRIFLYIACCLILISVFTGCGHFPCICPDKEIRAERYFTSATKLMEKGDYEASIAEIKRVMLLFPNRLESQGLFLMGLAYMHPENPGRDYKKSLECFITLGDNRKLEKSQIEIETEALIYRNLLEERIGKNKEIKELKHKIKSLKTKLMEQKKNTDKSKKQQKDLHSRIKKLKIRIKGLTDQIKNLKEIDLGIEEKKRKSLDKGTGTL